MIFVEEGECLVVAAALKEMFETGIEGGGELRLELDDFFRGGLEAFEVGCGIFLPGFVVGDYGEPFAQGVGESEVRVCGIHMG
jgi:hypothetical protein